MMRAVRAIAGLAVLVAAVGVPAASASAGTSGDTIAAAVPPGSHVSSVGHYYRLDMRPGESATQTLRVVNTNDHQVTAIVEGLDAHTGDATGVSFDTPGSPRAAIGRWIVVTAPQVTLAPKEARDVPFSVHVPVGITPGQYLGGVSASVPLQDTQKLKNGPRQATFALNLRFQRVIGVEIDVPGPRAPKLVVTGAEPKAMADGVALAVHMGNDGNAFARGNGVIRVADTNTDFTFPVDTFLGGTSIVYVMPKWTKNVVPGLHHVQVDLTYDGGRRTSWNGDINIAGALQDQLQQQLSGLQVHGPKPGGIDPLLMIALLLLLGFVGAAITLRRRSKRPRYVKYRAA